MSTPQPRKDELLARAEAEALRLHPFYRILPRMDEWDAFPWVAAAAGMAAQAEGVARLQRSHSELQAQVAKLMREAHETTRVLMREGLIAEPPGP